MGLLEELIILVKETIEEASERKRPEQMPSAPQRSPEEIEALRRTLAHRAAEQRQEEQQTDERVAHEQHAQHVQQERQRQINERERQRLRQVKAVQSAEVTRQVGAVDPRRVVHLLHQPNTLRELIMLKEILDKPLALRRR